MKKISLVLILLGLLYITVSMTMNYSKENENKKLIDSYIKETTSEIENNEINNMVKQ